MIAFAVLVAVLALPASAWAAPARSHGPAGAWNWLASLWQRGISLLGSVSDTMQKIQKGWDPNGSAAPDQGDAGKGFDPNG